MKPTFTLLVGDVSDQLATLPDESVHCVVTSPPYWGLRDYGTGTWTGGDPSCDHAVRADPKVASSTLGGGKATTGHQREGYKDACGRCNAVRVDQQLGLEATPELYVARMVEVFREVRRVLRSDGTLWLNLGDSYARGRTGRDDNGVSNQGRDAGWKQHPEIGTADRSIPAGLKDKDLVGIPWSVAKALQAPYYTGRIKSERDRIWLAAMVDAEGCIHVHRRAAGTSAHSTYTRKDGTVTEYTRKQDTFGVMVSIDNTSKAVIDRCHEIVGQGSRYVHEKGAGKQRRKQTIYRLTLTGQQSRELLRELYPHLVAKQREARIAYHLPSSGDGAMAAHEAIKALHNGRDTDIDADAPPSLFEPGWWLRSEVIWGKPNPMPESVTDRPTKAHEQVFLLTKRATYFYDADAVREPHSPDGRARTEIAPHEANAHENYNGRHGRDRWPGAGRNLRSVWTIPTEPYPEAHFATFPTKLVEPCVKAGCPEGGTVLDPFLGSGTTAAVAIALGRNAIGIELNPEYAALARRRVEAWGPKRARLAQLVIE